MFPSNDVFVNNLYPTFEGPSGSIGNFATVPYTPAGDNVVSMDKSRSFIENVAASGFGGNPLSWWFSLAVMLVVLMWFAQKYDGDGSYANLKLSAYNIFTISVAAIIGMSILKVASTKFPRPLAGLATVIQAA